MKESILKEEIRNRYYELLGESIAEEPKVFYKSFSVKGKVGDPWLEDLEWQFLYELKDDYNGIEINEFHNQIRFLFLDDLAYFKALNIVESRFQDIKPIINE